MLKTERIEIENNIASIYKMTLVGTCTSSELASELAKSGQQDSGILPKGTVQQIKRSGGKTLTLVGFPAKAWPDGITHPPVMFKFTTFDEGNTIAEVSIAYADNAEFDTNTILRNTGHRNVYGSSKICVGQAFKIPPALSQKMKIDLFVNMYFLASANADLDSYMRENKPSDLPSWEEMSEQKLDISGKIKDFRKLGTIGGWMCE